MIICCYALVKAINKCHIWKNLIVVIHILGVDNIFTSGVDVEISDTHGCIIFSMDVSDDRWMNQIMNDWFNRYSGSNVQMRNTLVQLNNSTVWLLQSSIQINERIGESSQPVDRLRQSTLCVEARRHACADSNFCLNTSVLHPLCLLHVQAFLC